MKTKKIDLYLDLDKYELSLTMKKILEANNDKNVDCIQIYVCSYGNIENHFLINDILETINKKTIISYYGYMFVSSLILCCCKNENIISTSFPFSTFLFDVNLRVNGQINSQEDKLEEIEEDYNEMILKVSKKMGITKKKLEEIILNVEEISAKELAKYNNIIKII